MGQLTLSERLADAQQRSVALYLRRQALEAQRQQVAQQAQMVEVELLTLDGETRVLTALLAEGSHGE